MYVMSPIPRLRLSKKTLLNFSHTNDHTFEKETRDSLFPSFYFQYVKNLVNKLNLADVCMLCAMDRYVHYAQWID